MDDSMRWPGFGCRFYLTDAVIFIGGQANSEIEKAAAEAGHPDVREAGERRSGDEGSSDQ